MSQTLALCLSVCELPRSTIYNTNDDDRSNNKHLLIIGLKENKHNLHDKIWINWKIKKQKSKENKRNLRSNLESVRWWLRIRKRQQWAINKNISEWVTSTSAVAACEHDTIFQICIHLLKCVRVHAAAGIF